MTKEPETAMAIQGKVTNMSSRSHKHFLPENIVMNGKYIILSLVTMVALFVICISYGLNIPINRDIRVFRIPGRQARDCKFQNHDNHTISKHNFTWDDPRLDILRMKAPMFDPVFKNPCWYEPLAEVDPYTYNPYASFSPYSKTVFAQLTEIWRERVTKEEHPCRLRCLPYFLLIGQPKCGSTNLFWKIAKHPQVTPPPIKELHWWSRTRPGRRLSYRTLVTWQDYVDMFDKAAYIIESFHHLASALDEPIITGDASVSLFWDNDEWSHYPANANVSSPRYVNAHYIRHMLPDVKLILILREPVSRLYSDYLYFHKDDKSPESFHEAVEHAIDLYTTCIRQTSVRQCVYNTTLGHSVKARLRVGLYSVYLKDWLEVFPRNQIHILRLEDFSRNMYLHLKEIYAFLDLNELTSEQWEATLAETNSNRRKETDSQLGDMYEKTRTLLKQFYQKFNRELADMLADDRYLWMDQDS